MYVTEDPSMWLRTVIHALCTRGYCDREDTAAVVANRFLTVAQDMFSKRRASLATVGECAPRLTTLECASAIYNLARRGTGDPVNLLSSDSECVCFSYA